MADHRIGEHVGAVAERGDDELVGRGEFGAERGAEAPAESAGGPEREERARLFARAMIRPQRIFVEDDGVLADRFADARDRYSGEIVVAGARNPWRVARAASRMRSVSRARRAAMRASAICSRGSTARVKRIERIGDAGLHREVARERAHRIAHVERILADMRDAAAARADAADAESTARRIRAR